MLNHKITVSISMEFLKSFSLIPKNQQKEVREFIVKFMNNPTSSSLNYEIIRKGFDTNLRSLRIDSKYRAIIAKPEQGNVYMLLWVDNHEAAYKWAERKRMIIHPETGALQCVYIEDKTVVQTVQTAKHIRGLFDDYTDKQLLQLGVPEEIFARVRKIVTEEDLERQEDFIPSEAYNSLFLLACGSSFEEVLKEYERPSIEIDTNDFWKALNNYDSMSRFKVIEGNEDLESLLNAPLEQWRVFLHPIQRKYVEMQAKNKEDSKGELKGGSIRVLGSAGTGKTVVAVHRAKWLLENAFTNNDDRILFTTFTKNLATDIKGYLQAICSQDQMKRIDVQNIDAWTHNYLKKCGYSAGVVLEDSESEEDSLWKLAINSKPKDENFSDQFYRDEWEQVIQPQSIFTVADYFKASRTGRGRSINRIQRKKIWPVFEEYRALLDEKNLKEKEDLYRDAKQLLEAGKQLPNYRAVIVDEAQDLSLLAFSMIRKIVPYGDNDIFIVGDSHQRIYGFKSSLSKSGINIQGRSRKLKINYRTTAETYRYATAILNDITFDDLDGNEDVLDKCQSITSGPIPEFHNFESKEEEKAKVIELIKKLSEKTDLRNVCLTARTKTYLNMYEKALKEADIPYVTISTQSSTEVGQEGIRLATMHRIKGIEFDYVIVVSASDKVLPLASVMNGKENPVDQKNFEIKERSLLYVACTRARKSLFITSSGTPSSLLPKVND